METVEVDMKIQEGDRDMHNLEGDRDGEMQCRRGTKTVIPFN